MILLIMAHHWRYVFWLCNTNFLYNFSSWSRTLWSSTSPTLTTLRGNCGCSRFGNILLFARIQSSHKDICYAMEYIKALSIFHLLDDCSKVKFEFFFLVTLHCVCLREKRTHISDKNRFFIFSLLVAIPCSACYSPRPWRAPTSRPPTSRTRNTPIGPCTRTEARWPGASKCESCVRRTMSLSSFAHAPPSDERAITQWSDGDSYDTL